MEDLKNYTVKIRQALSSDYQDYRLFTAGPPASGVVLLSALNILEGFNLSVAESNDAIVYHYIVEVSFLANALGTLMAFRTARLSP